MVEKNTDVLLKLILGALLHDIGKPVQRQGGRSGRHSAIGADFLDECGIKVPEILEQVRNHHAQEMKQGNFSKLAYITYIADNISAGADRREIEDGSPGFDTKTPLASVFNLLNKKSASHYHAPGMLDENTLNLPKPEKTIFSESTYGQIVEKLRTNLRQFDLSQCYLNALLEIFEATLSLVPSSTNKKEAADISLYDHAKLTACIAGALFLYLEDRGITDYETVLFKEEKTFKDTEFCMICSVDISGIQDFIYTLHSKDALKTLRGRSFFLEIFAENLIDNILSEFGLSRASLLYAGGGHFYLLLPNTDGAMEAVNAQISKTNAWLLSEFDNQLFVAHGFSPCSYNSLTDEPKGAYRKIYETVSEMVSMKKMTRYRVEDILHLNKKHQDGRECRICHKVSKFGEECEFCVSLIDFSKSIIEKDFFAIVNEKTHGCVPIMENQYLLALDEAELRELLTQDKLLRFFGKNRFFAGSKVSAKLWVGTYAKKELSKYADEAEGISRLGAMRLDVDNLGHAFTRGFENVDGKYNTISRSAVLSRMLGMFYKQHINHILHEDELDVSIIYSGGDDVYLAGAWWDVIAASRKIRRLFDKYTIGKLTVSAGVRMFTAKYPVHRMAYETGDLESVAKTGGKDRLTLFENYLCFTWAELDEVFDKYTIITENAAQNEKGTSFVYKLLNLVQTSSDTKTPTNINETAVISERQINIARFAYLLSSHAPAGGHEKAKSYDVFSKKMFQWVQNDKKQLMAALYLYLYKNRTGGE